MASMNWKNNAESTVSAITAGSLTIHVADGTQFPSSFPFLIDVWDDVSYHSIELDPDMEIMRCTGKDVNTLTVIRNQEGTGDNAHIDGCIVEMLITAGHFNDATYGITAVLDAHVDSDGSDHTFLDQDVTIASAPALAGTNITSVPADNVVEGELTKILTADERSAISTNTSKNTNVPTALSVGTINADTVAITSDGGADDVIIPAATNIAAGVSTAAQITKLEGIETAAKDDQDLSGLVAKSGSTMTGGLVLPAGSTTLQPLKMQSGALLTIPVEGVYEYLTGDLFFTVA